MNHARKKRTSSRAELTTLATDLDGTLIPLPGSTENEADLRTLALQIEQGAIELVFATGRHFASVSRAVQEFQLPSPQWIICDVGTSIYQRQPSGQFVLVADYQRHLQEITSCLPILELRDRIGAIDGLHLQEQEKPGPFKLSYYASAEQLDDQRVRVDSLLAEVGAPYSMIDSVDPFTGEGLIDLLPKSVSKAYALQWWSQHANRSAGEIVYAGDSGNDTAALVAGYRAIVVGNACPMLARRVYDEHRRAGWPNRLCLAGNKATSGVLEGCRWFGLIESED